MPCKLPRAGKALQEEHRCEVPQEAKVQLQPTDEVSQTLQLQAAIAVS